MEIGNEISGKIRSAIKAKLVELGSYVDDELPDYIMVMVANKKSKAQMTDDLNLFLGANTDVFTSWLHEVLNKLETATAGPNVTPTSHAPEQTTTDVPEKTTTDVPGKATTDVPEKTTSDVPRKATTDAPEKTTTEVPGKATTDVPGKTTTDVPGKTTTDVPGKTTTDVPGKTTADVSSDKSKLSESQTELQADCKKESKTELLTDFIKESKKSKKSKRSKDRSSHHKSSKRRDKKVLSGKVESSRNQEAVAAVATTSADASVEVPESLAAEQVSPITKPTSQELPAEAVISLNPDTHDFLDEEINQETKSQRKREENVQHKLLPSKSRPVLASPDRTSSVVASPQATVKAIASSPPAGQVTNRNGEKTAAVTKVRTTSASAPTHSTITVVASRPDRKRRGPGSVVGQVIEYEDDKEDSPVIKRVASTVELQRRPSLPISKQANMSLLKKAVSAAQESTKDVITHSLQNTAPVMVHTRPQATQKHSRCHRTTTASGAQKTLLVRAVNKATESTSSIKTHDAPMRVRQPQDRSITLHRTTSRTEIPRSGLVSRSRMREVAERDYDTQEFMKVEQSAPVHVKAEEYYADDEQQEEEMDAVDSRHIFVEDASTSRARAHIARSAREVQEMDYDRSSPDSDVAMVMESKAGADKHVVIKREKPVLPRPVSPKFIVTLDGPPRPQSSKKVTTKAAALVAPRMDITRTIDNVSATRPQVEAELVQSFTASYHDAYLPPVMPASEPELMYVSANQISTTAHQPMYSPTSIKMVSDFEKGVYARQTLEEQVALEPQQQQSDSSATMVQPPSERCRFWPACKNGNDCPYVHPTAPCKTFPNCKFGDKCVFIHPNCKFDARCTKINCPFTHASKRSPSAPAPPPRPVPRVLIGPPSRGQSKAACKFYPKCNNVDCPFVHPRACRFGNECTRNNCKFTHPQVATGAALKWSKEKHISERTFAVKSADEQLQLR